MRYTLFSNIRLFVGLAALLIMHSISAQQNQKIVFPEPLGFEKSTARQILNTPDGGWLLTGETTDNDEYFTLPRLIKVNAAGETAWDNTYLQPAPPKGARFTMVGTLNAPDGGWLVSVRDDSTYIDLFKVDADGAFVWSKVLPGDANQLQLVKVSPNNTYYAFSEKYINSGNNQWRFHELDLDGNILNTVALPPLWGNLLGGHSICMTSDNQIQVFYTKYQNNANQSFFARYDLSGNLIWESPLLTYNTSWITASANGGFISYRGNGLLQRFDATGVMTSESVLDPNFILKNIFSIEEAADGGIVVAGQTVTQRGAMAKIDAGFNPLWEAEAPLDEPQVGWLKGTGTSDGWAAGIGNTINAHIALVRIYEAAAVTIKTVTGKVFRDVDENCTLEAGEGSLKGTLVALSGPNGTFTAFSNVDGDYFVQTPPGEYVLNADPAEPFFFLCPAAVNTPVSLPVGPLANASVDLPIHALEPIHQIKGTVHLDENSNCTVDPGETAIPGWAVRVKGSNNTDLSDFTDTDGHYSVYVPDGTYTVSLQPLNPNFVTCGGNSASVTFQSPQAQTTEKNYVVDKAFDCGMMKVWITGNSMRPCTTSTIWVNYKNIGTAATDNVKITVILDPMLTYVSSDRSPLSVNGNVLVFDIGTVQPSYEGSGFWIKATPSCDLIIGQQVCVTGKIEPDTVCYEVPGWQGAIVAIDGECGPGANEATFKIRNIGNAANSTTLEYLIVEEQVVLKSGTFQLNPGDSITEVVTITNTTQIGTAQQEPGFPGGDTLVTYTLTNCVGSGGNSGGFNSPAGLFTSQTCLQIVNSYDPNDKTAQPLGYGPEHIVWPGTPLTYRIRFQNTGNDTAFLVVVRDTLSTDLNPATIDLLGGSHPYKFDLLAGRIMQFTFDNIQLPDSLTNPEGSQGFIDFSIKHRDDLPLGTTIGNSAAIYFDFNKPVITNTVNRKIDEYFTVTAVYTPGETVMVNIYPNPLTTYAVIALPETFQTAELLFELVDMSGKKVRSEMFTGGLYELNGGDLAAGVYGWQISQRGIAVAKGKAVVR